MQNIIKAIEQEGLMEITDEPYKVPHYTSAKQIIEIFDSEKGWRVWVK